MERRLDFFLRFLRRPGRIGAITPSSAALAEAMTDWIRWDEVDSVVEFGCGDGAFTSVIRRRLKPGAAFLAIEAEADLAERVRRRFPDVAVHCACATRLRRYLDEHGIDKVDCVISGLPWASFPAGLQDDLMATIQENLRPGGRFTTFAYLHGLVLPAARRFRRRLDESFPSVTRSPTIWRNAPPAFVYRCEKGKGCSDPPRKAPKEQVTPS